MIQFKLPSAHSSQSFCYMLLLTVCAAHFYLLLLLLKTEHENVHMVLYSLSLSPLSYFTVVLLSVSIRWVQPLVQLHQNKITWHLDEVHLITVTMNLMSACFLPFRRLQPDWILLQVFIGLVIVCLCSSLDPQGWDVLIYRTRVQLMERDDNMRLNEPNSCNLHTVRIY